MHGRKLILASALLAAGACSAEQDDHDVRVQIAPNLLFPRGLLDNVTKLTLTVYDPAAGLGCDAKTGKLVGLVGMGTPIATKDLGTTNCPAGSKFCGDLAIPKGDAVRIFSARAQSAAVTDYADGCATAVANQDALPLHIAMIRNVPPAVCGNGTIESTEQCDPTPAGSDPACDATCHSVEVQLSIGSGGTSTGNPGEKVNPSFVWPVASGDSGRFLSFFGDASPGPANTQVTMRVLTDSFAPIATLPASLFLPNNPAEFPPNPEPKSRFQPAAAAIGSTYFVVFQEDNNSFDGGPDIHFRSMDATFTAQQAAPIGINGMMGQGEANIQSFPAISAGPNGLLLVAWQDDFAQTINARTVQPGNPPTLGTQQQFSSGSSNSHVTLAATATGWLAVWDGGGDVKLRAIDASGTPQGAEQIVNERTQGTQDHSSLAALGDGRFAVVWSDHAAARGGADIVMQRYAANVTKVAGDQTTAVNTTVTGDQITPQIASTTAASGSFVVVWLDAAAKHVRGRLAGGTAGFLFNNVDGQPTDFQASVASGRPRANPTVAVGGAGPFIAIGWEDSGAAAPLGIIARRYPLPTWN